MKTIRIKPSKVADFINNNSYNGKIFDLVGYGPFTVDLDDYGENDWMITGQTGGYYITTSEIERFFDVDESDHKPEVEAVCDSQGPEPSIKTVVDVKLGDGILRKTEQVQLNMVVTKDNVGDLIKFLTREFDYE